MKRLTTIVCCLALVMTVQAKKEATRTNGYPITQVPFTAVKVTPNTFWGDRIRAAREVTISWPKAARCLTSPSSTARRSVAPLPKAATPTDTP